MASLQLKSLETLLSMYVFEVDPNCPNEGLTCIVCGHFMMKAYQTYCGCKYCRQCIIKHLSDKNEYCSGGQSDCREEKLVLDKNVCSIPALNRKILKSRVICPFESCGAIIELSKMDAHIEKCPQRPMDCPYLEFRCTFGRTSREKIENHLHKEILAHSQLVVKEKRVEFDMFLENQKNESIMKNKEMNEILSKMERDKSEAILREGEVETLKKEVKRVNESNARLQTENAETRNKDAERMAKVEEDLKILGTDGETEKEESKKMRSEMENLKKGVIRISKGNVRLGTENAETRNKMIEMMRILMAKVETESTKMRSLVENLEKEVLRVNENNVRLEMENTKMRSKMIEDTDCADSAATSGMVFEISRAIDCLPIGVDKECAVGELWFTLDRIAERMETGEYVDTPHLYSHANGYKLKMCVDPRGHECLCVSSVVCKGECDAVLPWPCRFTLLVAVVHRHTKQLHEKWIITYDCDTDNRYCKKPIDIDNPPYPQHGWISLASYSDIRCSGTIIDDSLLFHIVVAR